MAFNPDIHKRGSQRLKGYDYSLGGAYFITICAYHREMVFGFISGDKMKRNKAGEVTAGILEHLPERFPGLIVDRFVIMPNHVHIIMVLTKGAGHALGQTVGAFKSLSARAVNRVLGRSKRPLWQRGYHDHIIGGTKDLNRIRQYIEANPGNWDDDQENPACRGF